MPWLRVSDSAGNNPIVLEPLTDPAPPPAMDVSLWANTIMGVVTRAATSAAGYNRSYVVSDATVAQIAGPQWRTVAEAAERAGYWTRVEQGWQLIEDSDHLFHIRRGEEIDWEKARKADTANSRLTAPVRWRDGDGCRYCGVIVIWGDMKSARGGTYDHRVPGRAALTHEDLRVACRGCNSSRGNNPSADDVLPPLPPPVEPHYGPKTVAFLKERGFNVHESAPARPGDQPDPAPRDPGAASLETPRPSDPEAIGITPAPPSDRAAGATPQATTLLPVDAGSVDPANRRATESRSPGRDGHTGRIGKGRSGSGSRRARRGKGKRS